MLVMVVHGYMVLAGKLAGMEWGVSAGGGCRQAEGVRVDKQKVLAGAGY